MIEKNSLNQIRPLYQYLRKQAENKKATKYLEITATFTLIAIFLFLAIQPTALAISSLLGEIKSKEIASQKMKLKINSVIQAQDSFSQAQEKYSTLDSGFPSNPHFYQAAVNFSTLAQESSLDVKQIDFSLPNEDEKDDDKSLTKSFQINFSSSGQYQSALSFIKGVINNRRLIDISSIRFSRPSDDSDTGQNSNLVNLTIESNLFYSPIETNGKN